MGRIDEQTHVSAIATLEDLLATWDTALNSAARATGRLIANEIGN